MGCLQGLVLAALLLFSAVAAQAQDITMARRPFLVTSKTDAAFEFWLRDGLGQRQRSCQGCSIMCRLDEAPFQDCSGLRVEYGNLTNGPHSFEVSVKASNFSASNIYNWTIDSVPPTGSVTVDREFTNAFNTTLRIKLSEPCAGNGGFKCHDVASCDVVVRGSGVVVPASLTVVHPYEEYKLVLDLADKMTGRVSVTLAKGFCTDASGNKFVRTGNSSVVVHFDRNPVSVNVWTAINELQVIVDGQPRTVQATRKTAELGIFLDFTEPIVNSTEDLLSVLSLSAGVLQPTRRKSHGNRRFGFLLMGVPQSTAVTVNMASGIRSRSGALVTTPAPVTLLYDSSRPRVELTAASPLRTRGGTIAFWVRFSESVFNFDSSGLSLSGGRITSFKEITKALYFVELTVGRSGTLSVFVAENKTADIAGNFNLASNHLQFGHFLTPTVAVASSSFIAAGLLSSLVASGLISISSSALAAAGVITSRLTASITSNPSRNLLGMVGHLQVYALSYHVSADFPVQYSETVRRLQWCLPHLQLPWVKESNATGRQLAFGQKTPFTLMVGAGYRRKLGANTTVYGPALTASEYRLYFQATGTSIHRLAGKYTGWEDFGKDMFWLAAIIGSMLAVHLLLVAFLRWRTKASIKGALCFPRLELFMLMLAVPAISQAAAFIIRGGTAAGITVGVLLLGIPTALFLSVFVFLSVAVIWGALVQYKEYRTDDNRRSCCSATFSSLAGQTSIGKWVRKEGISSSFLPRYGILFESRKGPPKVVFIDSEYGSKWVDSDGKGIGRMKPVNNSDEDSVDHSVSKAHKLLGSVKAFYVLVDIARRVALGALFSAGAEPSHFWSAFAVTLLQLLYLILAKPYIRRGVHIVEAVSLSSELALFIIGVRLSADGPSATSRKSLGISMVTLLLASFMFQLMNEWYALMEQVIKLSAPQEPSVTAGLKMLFKGLLFPFLPQRRWRKFISRHEQPTTGLSPVVHFSPSPDFQRSKVLPTVGSPMTETGGHIYDPGSPSFFEDPATLQARRSGPLQPRPEPRSSQWRRSSSSRISRAGSNELKTLRELAKASFPGSSKREEDHSEQAEQQLPPTPTTPTTPTIKASRSSQVQRSSQVFLDDVSGEVLPLEVVEDSKPSSR